MGRDKVTSGCRGPGIVLEQDSCWNLKPNLVSIRLDLNVVKLFPTSSSLSHLAEVWFLLFEKKSYKFSSYRYLWPKDQSIIM